LEGDKKTKNGRQRESAIAKTNCICSTAINISRQSAEGCSWLTSSGAGVTAMALTSRDEKHDGWWWRRGWSCRQAPEIKSDYSVKRADYNIYPRSSWPIGNLEKPARGVFEWRICRANRKFSIREKASGSRELFNLMGSGCGDPPLSISNEFDSAVRKLSRFRGTSARLKLDRLEKCVIARKPTPWTFLTDQLSRKNWIWYYALIIRELFISSCVYVIFNKVEYVIEGNYVSNAFTKALFIHNELFSI